MITVGEAINRARDEHPAFTEQAIPDSVLRRKLDEYQRELYALAVDKDPQWVATVETITLSSYDFSTGFTPSNPLLKPLGGEVHFPNDDRSARLKWVPYKNRKAPTVPWPAYYLDGDVYLCGISDDWEPVDTVDLHIITEPTSLTANTDTFDLPEGAKTALVKRAALEMAKRGPSTGAGQAPDVQAFLALFERAEDRLETELAERDSVEETYIREEW